MKHILNVSPLIKEYELRKGPIIIRVNKFDEESAAKFVNEMAHAHNTGQKVIPIVVDSFGGDAYSLMTYISAIKDASLPIATIIEGKAMSCGSILASFGTEGLRFMDPNATVMIHDAAWIAHGKTEEMKASTAELDRLNEKIYVMMSRNCGKSDDYFAKKLYENKHADWYLNAEEAKQHGLINHLRLPTLSININVDIEFE